LYVAVVAGSDAPGGYHFGRLQKVFWEDKGQNGVENNGNGKIDDAGEFNWKAIVDPLFDFDKIVGTPNTNSREEKQGFINFSIRADPVNSNVVFVGGDETPNLYRGDASKNEWRLIAKSSNTKHHSYP